MEPSCPKALHYTRRAIEALAPAVGGVLCLLYAFPAYIVIVNGAMFVSALLGCVVQRSGKPYSDDPCCGPCCPSFKWHFAFCGLTLIFGPFVHIVSYVFLSFGQPRSFGDGSPQYPPQWREHVMHHWEVGTFPIEYANMACALATSIIVCIENTQLGPCAAICVVGAFTWMAPWFSREAIYVRAICKPWLTASFPVQLRCGFFTYTIVMPFFTGRSDFYPIALMQTPLVLAYFLSWCAGLWWHTDPLFAVLSASKSPEAQAVLNRVQDDEKTLCGRLQRPRLRAIEGAIRYYRTSNREPQDQKSSRSEPRQSDSAFECLVSCGVEFTVRAIFYAAQVLVIFSFKYDDWQSWQRGLLYGCALVFDAFICDIFGQLLRWFCGSPRYQFDEGHTVNTANCSRV